MQNPTCHSRKPLSSEWTTLLAASRTTAFAANSFVIFLENVKRFAACLGVLALFSFSLNLQAQTQPARRDAVNASYEIRLQSRRFTPQAGIPTDLRTKIRRVISQTGSTDARAHVLLQLKSPPESTDRENLSRRGITLLEPVNKVTWLAAVTSRGADLLATTNQVRWADLIKPEDKLANGVQKGAPVLPYQLRPGNRIAYSVRFHKDVTAEEVRAFAGRADIRIEGFDAKAFPVVRAVIISVPKDGIMILAEANIVAWIEASPPPDIDDNLLSAQPLSNVDDLHAAPFSLNGTGVTVGVWESGDTILAAHLDLTPRVIIEPGQSASTDVHATHVAGTIGASGVNIPNAQGMAPNATIASWDASNDANEMTNARTSPGGAGNPTPIRISNHSYGRTIGWDGTVFNNNQDFFGRYTNQSQNYDNVVSLTGLMVMKAAGNDRNDAPAAPVAGQPADCFQGGLPVAADCIEDRAVAKNVITVGAMNGAGAITTFSNFGPTDDGRIKPDLMAQGFNMLSLSSAATDATASSSGTSMATPVVSGIAALVLQEANARNITMSPAAMKALLIQTARDVTGIGQSNPGPDFATGWGIVDAQAAVNLLRQSGLVQATLTDTGLANAWTGTFYVPEGLPEFHLTLVWDDPPGTPGGQILINDLDLRLIAPDGAEFNPWTLDPANPATAAVRNGGNDTVNNVEQVSVLAPPSGTWTVRVSANAGNLPQAPQNFAVAGVLPHSDVMLVMDRSGSMSLPSGTAGVNKLEALQSAANEFIDLLDLAGGHRLGLVQFEENAVAFAPAFNLQALSAINVTGAHAAVNSMVHGGWTNIISGVTEASNQLGTSALPSPRQSIVLFSDGKHNRPIGSDLTAINATVQAGNDRFYSIGFGTDVDDDILTTVANNSGGIHLNEQDLSPIQLTKHFLTIGALVHDMTVLVDPTFQLGPTQSARVPVTLSELDRFVTFAVNWTGKVAGDVRVTIQPPDRRCRIPITDHKGVRVKRGDHYRLIRVQLPYFCNGRKIPEGEWAIYARPDNIVAQGKETVDIMILGDSRLKLQTKTSFLDNRRFMVTASFLRDGKHVTQTGQTVLSALVLHPQDATRDSATQDVVKHVPFAGQTSLSKKEFQPVTVRLNDNGRDGDQKAGDGIFTAILDTSGMKPGLLRARVISTVPSGKLKLKREASVSFYVKR